ncbi:hypothetical protein DPEC_G00183480 [Dallia pectoralis]|uniref:Uncharacterized protein n=1 Tax=Dallia pectoralis TaxID=75939 RepID=A0ACC2GB60_DALPE|nr:hypothetical protein DPEC_G00183480 [Dallia pectoralis]
MGQFVLFFPYFSTSERELLELLSPVQTKTATGGEGSGVVLRFFFLKKGTEKRRGEKTEPLRKAAGNTEARGSSIPPPDSPHLLTNPPSHRDPSLLYPVQLHSDVTARIVLQT